MANLGKLFSLIAGTEEQTAEPAAATNFNTAAEKVDMTSTAPTAETPRETKKQGRFLSEGRFMYEGPENIIPVQSLSDDAFAAVKRGDLPKVRELLDRGFDVNARDSEGFTMLMRAVAEHKTEIGQLLLLRQADPEMRNDAGMTALMLAATGNNIEMAKILLDEMTDSELDDDDIYSEEIALEKGNMAVYNMIRLRRLDREKKLHVAGGKEKKGEKEQQLQQQHFSLSETFERSAGFMERTSAFLGKCAHSCAAGVKASVKAVKEGWAALSRFLHLASPEAGPVLDVVDTVVKNLKDEEPAAPAAAAKAPAPAPEPPKPAQKA